MTSFGKDLIVQNNLMTYNTFLVNYPTIYCDSTTMQVSPAINKVNGACQCLIFPAEPSDKDQEIIISHEIEDEQLIPFWTFHEDSVTVEDVIITWRKTADGDPNHYIIRRHKQQGTNELNAGEMFVHWFKKQPLANKPF